MRSSGPYQSFDSSGTASCSSSHPFQVWSFVFGVLGLESFMYQLSVYPSEFDFMSTLFVMIITSHRPRYGLSLPFSSPFSSSRRGQMDARNLHEHLNTTDLLIAQGVPTGWRTSCEQPKAVKHWQHPSLPIEKKMLPRFQPECLISSILPEFKQLQVISSAHLCFPVLGIPC